MKGKDYAWHRALRDAIKRNRRDAHNRYLQLATVRADGSPAVRSLVFRGYCEETDRLHMVTDARSDKVSDIEAGSGGEICWYFSHTREQFRLRGSLSLSGADDSQQTLRHQLWEDLSDKAREQFSWPHPKHPVGDEKACPQDPGLPPPASFLALSMHVAGVDHLILRGDPQRRFCSRRDSLNAWHVERVNP